jgi:hypothetical protein
VDLFRQASLFVPVAFIGMVEAPLAPWTWVVLEKLTVPQLVKKIPHFLVHDGSLQHLKETTATLPYPETDQLNTRTASHILNTHFNNILPSTRRPS